MKANRLFITLLVVFTFTCNISIAQSVRSLDAFLNTLEKRFNVVFTYADKNIRGISISTPRKDLSLDECLVFMEQQTDLEFKRLNTRYIAIRRKVRHMVVSGTVIDISTKERLVGALVYSGKDYTFSDMNGRFSLVLSRKKDSLLTIRYTGHKPLFVKQSLWHNYPTVYKLTPEVLALDEVVVNFIARGINKLSDGSIQANVRNIETLPGLSEPDVLRAVQVLPGIQSINESVSDISIRGGTNDQNLVLWDGVKMYQTGHFFGLISAYNSHLINKTSIVKNGSCAAFAEGISGVIDMRQQDYAVNELEISTGINMISADAVVKVPVSKKLSLLLGARHSLNDLFISPTFKSYYKRAFEETEVLEGNNSSATEDYHDFSFYDLSCKLIYDITNKDKLRVSVLNVDNNIQYEESDFLDGIMQRKTSSLSQSSILSNIQYVHTWDSNNSTQLSGFVSSYSLDGSNAELLTGQNHIQKNEVIDYGLKLDSRHKMSETVGLSVGYHLNEIGIENQDNIHKPDYYKTVKEVLLIHSLYSEAEFNRLFDKLYLRLGLRANYYTKFSKLLFEPRAALNFKLTDYISLEALAEQKNQHTMQSVDYQTDFLGVEKRRWLLSNDDGVPIMNSRQFSLGANYNRNNFLVSVEAYSKNVTGIISPGQGFQNQYQYTYATGDYKTRGVELLINKRLKQYNFWLNYTLAKNEYFFNDFIPPSFPNNLDIRHTISLGGGYHYKNLEVSGGFNYRTGKPYTLLSDNSLSSENDITYAEPNNARLHDFIRLDVSAKYHFKLKNIKGECGVSVWNILNTKNDINIYYQLNADQEIEQITKHALGITPNVYLRLNF